MDYEEICDHLSPGEASSATGQPIQPPQPAPPLVRIPYRTILAFVLDGLGLPQAQYTGKIYDGNKVCVTVLFHTSVAAIGDKDARMIIHGVRSVDRAMSEDTAAMEAIRYLESTAKTEVRDFNYSQMKKLEAENKSLKHELSMAYTRVKKNGQGWFASVRYMSSFSDHIRNMITLNMPLKSIKVVAKRIKCKATWMENKLNNMLPDPKVPPEMERMM